MRCGDQSNYDGNVANQWVRGLLYLIQDFYQDEHFRVRTILFADFMQTFHIFYNFASKSWVLYQTLHGNKSGCILTTVMNSYVNACVMRAVYQYIWCNLYTKHEDADNYQMVEDFDPELVSMDLADYNANVTEAYFGDDDGGETSPYAKWFNMINIQLALEAMGYTYTSAKKDGTIVPFLPLSEFSFLKRGFRQDTRYQDVWWAPLDLAPVNELLNWTKDGRDRELAFRDNFETFQHYLAEYGQEKYEEEMRYVYRKLQEMGVDVAPKPWKMLANSKYASYGKMPERFIVKTLVNQIDEIRDTFCD